MLDSFTWLVYSVLKNGGTTMVMKGSSEFQVLDGVSFFKDKAGYFLSRIGGDYRYIHREVYTKHRGRIPYGLLVHHVDEDKSNNDISNLVLMTLSEHATYHASKRAFDDPIGCAERLVKYALPAAMRWARANPDKVKINALQSCKNLDVSTFICTQCGKEYETYTIKLKKGYCSPACQQAARRSSGVDNETRVCEVCENTFTVNKYKETRVCSRKCTGALISRSRQAYFKRLKV